MVSFRELALLVAGACCSPFRRLPADGSQRPLSIKIQLLGEVEQNVLSPRLREVEPRRSRKVVILRQLYLEHFLTASASWLVDGQCCRLRYICEQGVDGDLRVLRAALDIRAQHAVGDHPFEVASGSMRGGIVLTEPMSRAQLQAIVQDAANGRFALGPKEMLLEPSESSYHSENASREYHQRILHLSIGSSLQLHQHGFESGRMDSELRWGEPPFDGLSDLCRHLNLAGPYNTSEYANAHVRIEAPVELLPGTSLSKGLIRVEVRAMASLDPALVKLAMIGLTRTRTVRQQLSSKFVWTTSAGWMTGQVVAECPDTEVAKCLLGLGNDTIWSQRLIDPSGAANLRSASLIAVDPGLRALRAALLPANVRELGVPGQLADDSQLGAAQTEPAHRDEPHEKQQQDAERAIRASSSSRQSRSCSICADSLQCRLWLTMLLTCCFQLGTVLQSSSAPWPQDSTGTNCASFAPE